MNYEILFHFTYVRKKWIDFDDNDNDEQKTLPNYLYLSHGKKPAENDDEQYKLLCATVTSLTTMAIAIHDLRQKEWYSQKRENGKNVERMTSFPSPRHITSMRRFGSHNHMRDEMCCHILLTHVIIITITRTTLGTLANAGLCLDIATATFIQPKHRIVLVECTRFLSQKRRTIKYRSSQQRGRWRVGKY